MRRDVGELFSIVMECESESECEEREMDNYVWIPHEEYYTEYP